MNYRLQKYEDGTFGYLYIDADEYEKFKSNVKVECTQGENEDREEFIRKYNLDIKPNQYGANLAKDIDVMNAKFTNGAYEELIDSGYALDYIINDRFAGYSVQKAIVQKGYRLDTFINSKDARIRAEVAKQKYGLDILINDDNPEVRAVIANQGYGLNVLVNDTDEFVRRLVARQGYGLNKLIEDKNDEVVEEVQDYLRAEGLTLAEWEDKYPNRIVAHNSTRVGYIVKCYWKFSYESPDNNTINCSPQKALDSGYITIEDLKHIIVDESYIKYTIANIRLEDDLTLTMLNASKHEIGGNNESLDKCRNNYPPQYYLLFKTRKNICQMQHSLNRLVDILYVITAQSSTNYKFTYTLYFDEDSIKEYNG